MNLNYNLICSEILLFLSVVCFVKGDGELFIFFLLKGEELFYS